MWSLDRKDIGMSGAERIKPSLNRNERQSMNKAIAAPPLRTLFTKVADKVHWYLLDAPPSLRGRHFGVANSQAEAEEIISKLCPSSTGQSVFA